MGQVQKLRKNPTTSAGPAAEGDTPPSPARRDTIGSVEHAIALLRCLSEAGAPVGTNEVARRIGIHKSSVSRLAATLERAHIIQRNTESGRLSLGVGLLALAAPLLAGFELRESVRPVLERLAADTGETASFSVWDGAEAVSVEQVPGSNSVRAFSSPGHRNPGHATASGKILLAHAGEAAIADYCRIPLQRFTDTTLTDAARVAAELATCRQRNCAVNLGEFESDVGAVSAGAFDRLGHILGAVTVTVPMYRFGEERRPALTRMVVQCAADISARLAYAKIG